MHNPDPIVYIDGNERRTLDLRPDGVACIPVLGLSNFQTARTGTEEHVHPGCVEISLCVRGNLMFESQGESYPFLPGTVFVSQPTEPHRMRHNPKGLMLYRILFKIPSGGENVLGLPADESRWLVWQMTHFPLRLFSATERVKTAFERLFEVYDMAGCRSAARRLKMKSAALELLLALVEAPYVPASPKGRRNPKVVALVARMQASPEMDYPLEAMAREVALSTVALNDAFKRLTGLPPHAYLLDCRLKKGCELLRKGESVGAVSHRLGFSSPRHFATALKRATGCSPRDFRA
jgi:AraC-like DNA-binding protein